VNRVALGAGDEAADGAEAVVKAVRGQAARDKASRPRHPRSPPTRARRRPRRRKTESSAAKRESEAEIGDREGVRDAAVGAAVAGAAVTAEKAVRPA